MGEIKTAYIEELKHRLNTTTLKLQALQSRIDKANLEHGHSLFQEMNHLYEQSDQTRAKLQALIESDHPDWQDLKQGIENAWDTLQADIHRIADGLAHQWDN